MDRPNVEVIAGNHCVMACECFAFLLQEITEDSLVNIDEEMIEKLINWQQNGSISTTDEFHKYYRIRNGLQWFESEQLDDEIKEYVERQLKKIDWKVKNVVSGLCMKITMKFARKSND